MILPSQNGWQQQLAQAMRDPRELLRALELDIAAAPEPVDLDNRFRMRVPKALLSRIRIGDWTDPILRQVLPLQRETEATAGYVADPLDESAANPAPGVIHKYHGRVLLITSPACAVHCRYCFRRHFPYEENAASRQNHGAALEYIRNNPEISEVILSGGDPLAIADHHLRNLVEALADIPHVRRLRVHTRLPVVIPDRITGELLATLTATRLAPVLVLHINHANEIDGALSAAIARVRDRGIPLLNQTVLLRGINDSVSALSELSEALFAAAITPYYLHLLDPVAGAAHFDLDEHRARDLHATLLATLPGYLVPRLVREEPGKSSKTVLA